MKPVVKTKFHGTTIASFEENGVVWAHFPAVLEALGHLANESLTAHARQETARSIWTHLDDDERREVSIRDKDGTERIHKFVSEPGMYHIAAKFDTAVSRSFRRWVTHELIPAYRKGELVKRDVEATGRELALQIQHTGTALVQAFDRIEKVERITVRHESDISELKKEGGELAERFAQLTGEAPYVTVRARMLRRGIRPNVAQKYAQSLGGKCYQLARERNISLPPKIGEGTYMVNQYPVELIDEVLKAEGLIQ